MNGCVAAISVDTGKVLDIEVICRPTVQHVRDFRLCQETLNMSRQKADHICQCNFTGSSSKMEIVGASRIFLRSEKPQTALHSIIWGWRLKSFHECKRHLWIKQFDQV
ncbi:hypothetical protein TNCV_4713851 [Trichonephila clavipes]|nr:hypothetical protein TNCV_4713851 [Trichonephila clavipes]